VSKPHISREKRVHGKSASFAFIVGKEHDADVFDGDHYCQSPDNEGNGTENVVLAWLTAEC
jgi:hypothetical protein